MNILTITVATIITVFWVGNRELQQRPPSHALSLAVSGLRALNAGWVDGLSAAALLNNASEPKHSK